MLLRSPRPGRSDGVSTARRAAVPLLALVGVAALSSCSAGEPSEPEEPAPSGSAAPTDARATVSAGRVTGTLDRARRDDAADAVGTVTERWFTAAYLGQDGPPSRVADAFPGFTAGAAAQARDDRGLTTNTGLAAGVDDVVARRADVAVDLLATGGRARAATARFTLVMELTGDGARVERVAGRLYLTPDPARGGPGWQVVGYDVERGRQR
ncbi:hypothetical protein [Nocardioides sp. AX2bis]|uniref:hypothetical protein n=1 Tax=Nocardioides sp. AX2bis TaxID=2653157 RepID=UPI0012F32589|nr:hypothetical protein [Nocardioides sp. AX2bis]VXB20250.1 conserved exported hypothetical protein [Nocardioides sp. AX2bis]